LDKRACRQVPTIEATPQDISLAKRVKAAKYIAKTDVSLCGHKKTLLLYLFPAAEMRNGKTEAAYRVFLTHDDYITQDLKSKTIKWYSGRLYSITWTYSDYSNKDWITFADDISVEVVQKFFKSKGDPIRIIQDFQEEVGHERLMKKYKLLMHQIDEKMALVPPLPRDFKKWVDEFALYDSRYLIYKYDKRKEMKGYCTHCRHDVLITAPHHNHKGICPHCGSPVTFKASGKFGRVRDREQITLMQRSGDGFVFRCFRAYKDYACNYRNPKLDVYESMRTFTDKDFNCEGKGLDSFSWNTFRPNIQIMRWKDDSTAGVWYEGKVYWKNLQDVLQGSKCQYSCLWTLLEKNPEKYFYPLGFLQGYKPCYEYLIKLGMTNLVFEDRSEQNYWHDEDVKISEKSNSITEALKVPKNMIPALKSMNPTKRELAMFRTAAAAGKWTTPEEVREVERTIDDSRVFSIKEATPHKIIKYISQVVEKSDRVYKIHEAFSDWYDYLGFCRELGYDLKNSFVLFPKDLDQAHDNAAGRVQLKKDKEADEIIKQLYPLYKKLFSWEFGEYVMVVPHGAEDIIKEGQNIHNCVGGYVQRVAEKSTIILFLRRKEAPTKSLFTVEYRRGKVVQCRPFGNGVGLPNGGMTSEIKDVIKKFERDIKARTEKSKIGVGAA
jgi:hypothetical protein